MVETSGSGLQIEATVTVGWQPGHGVNIGNGQSSNIAVAVRRGFNLRETVSIPVDSGGPVFSGHFSVDREAMRRLIVAAIGRIPGT